MLHSIEWRLPALGRAAEQEIASRMFVKVTVSLLSTGWLSKVLTRTEDYQQNVEQLTKWEF